MQSELVCGGKKYKEHRYLYVTSRLILVRSFSCHDGTKGRAAKLDQVQQMDPGATFDADVGRS